MNITDNQIECLLNAYKHPMMIVGVWPIGIPKALKHYFESVLDVIVATNFKYSAHKTALSLLRKELFYPIDIKSGDRSVYGIKLTQKGIRCVYSHLSKC